MPYEVKVERLPAGYSLEAAKAKSHVQVSVREFTSSEDGDLFMSRLEGYPTEILSLVRTDPPMRPSTVDHMLVVVRKDRSATVYINELPLLAEVQVKRAIQAGQYVWADDVADVARMKFRGIEIPQDAGVPFLFSVGWRKGLYYDFEPLVGTESCSRGYDLEQRCGQYYAYLLRQELFRITEQDWQRLFAEGWFPFVALREQSVHKLLTYVRQSWRTDDLLHNIAEDLDARLDPLLALAACNPFFEPHRTLIEKAIERYKNNDHVSVASILYPRIEGIMRTYHAAVDVKARPTYDNIVRSTVEGAGVHRRPFSFLLPHQFQRYLREVYLADFEPKEPKGISRHTVAHGVAPSAEFSRKSAVIGLLILDQLSYYLKSV